MVEENSKIITLVEKKGYKAGTIGVVVSIYSMGSACEVELWDDNDYPIDVITYLFSEIKVIEA